MRVFATGGLGGVHRGARDTWDESADLETLASTGIVVVCAGVKSILDVGATLERLETLNVTVVGYGTDRFPGFYLSDSGHPVPWRVESAREVAALVRRARGGGHRGQRGGRGEPAAARRAARPGAARQGARRGAGGRGARGRARARTRPRSSSTTWRAQTEGASLEANVRLVLRNARLAAEIATELAA